MRFSKQRGSVQSKYLLSGTFRSAVTEVKYVAVWFSSDLSWKKNIKSVTASANSTFYFIRRNFKKAAQTAKLLWSFLKCNAREFL